MNEELKNIFSLRVDEVLHYIWDPIGVVGAPEARDEYTTYLPRIVDAIVNGQDTENVAKMLYEIETKNMELVGNLSKCTKVSELVFDWYDFLKNE